MATAASLPFDVLTSIFKFLDTQDKGKAAQVCTSWRMAADSKFLWHGVEVKLRSKFVNSETSYSIVNRDLKRLRVVDFTPREEICLFERLTDFVQNLSNVNSLNLTDCVDLSDELLEVMICNLPNLCELNLSGCPFIDSPHLRKLGSDMISLQTLYLNEHTINALNHVCDSEDDLPRKTDLLLQGFFEGTRVLTLKLYDASKTFYRALRGFKARRNEVLKHLPFLKKLESLNLAFSLTLSDCGMNYVTRIASLKHLDLTACPSISDDGCRYLSQLTNLTDLNLSLCCRITDDTLKYLNKLASLRKLNLFNCRISDIGLFYLTSGDLMLTELNLSCCFFVGDEGILELCRSSFVLEALCLNCTNVTDYGIGKIVEKFPHLQTLKSTVHVLSKESTQKIREKLQPFRM